MTINTEMALNKKTCFQLIAESFASEVIEVVNDINFLRGQK
jgi:hypothetical protein